MSETRIVTDTEQGIALNSLRVEGAAGSFLAKTTLAGGPSAGVDLVELNNGALSLKILPTRGMSVWKGAFRTLPLEWKSPVQFPVHPSLVNLHDRNGLGWLNGFNELMCRCGLGYNGPPGNDNGEAITLHGRIGNLPAHRVEFQVDQQQLTVTGEVDEASMFGTRWRLRTTYTTQIGSPTVDILDEVTNLSGKPMPLSLLYHINVGRPFLEAGSQLVVPFREIAPRDARAAEETAGYATYAEPNAAYAEQAYYFKPAADAEGWTGSLLHNSTKTAGVVIWFRPDQLPCFTQWKNTIAEADGYVTGMEPGVNFPNFRAYERDHQRLPVVGPQATARFQQRWEFLDQSREIEQVRAKLAAIQPSNAKVHLQPQPGWSPAGEAHS